MICVAGTSKPSEAQPAAKQQEAVTPTLTFRTPSVQPQQRTPTLSGPALLQPQSPRPYEGATILALNLPRTLTCNKDLIRLLPTVADSVPTLQRPGGMNSDYQLAEQLSDTTIPVLQAIAT